MTRALMPRLRGLAAVLAIAAYVAGVPTLLIVLGASPSPSTLGRTREVLLGPDDGTLALGAAAVVAWVAWALMTVSLVTEMLARLRGVRAPRLPGLAVPQLAAGRLVTTAALLFAAVPATTTATPVAFQAVSLPGVAASQVARGDATQPSPPPHHGRTASPTSAATTMRPAPPRSETRPHTVKRGESLWSIARDQLGDGTRYVELVDLNAEVLHGRPDFIAPGQVLLVPDDGPTPDASSATADTHVVVPGDTLSEIAVEELGDASAYPEIYDASRDTVQADGQRLTDPDLILPGWHLTVPDRDAPQEAPEPNRPRPGPPVTGRKPPPDAGPSAPTARSRHQPEATTPRSPEPPTAAVPAPPRAEQVDDQAHGWLLPGLTGGGALLAGSLLLVVQSRRRTQQRYRRPGHVIAPPPPALLPIEKTLRVSGTPALSRVERLDALLRQLGAAVSPAPALETVEVSGTNVRLRLAAPADLPPPWRGAHRGWIAPLDADLPTEIDALAGYPLLVTVGHDDAGHLWLVNLEGLQAIAVVGDRANAESFGRHVIAELAVNPWSTRVDVHAVEIGGELDRITYRVDHHPRGDTDFLRHIESTLTDNNRLDALDPETFHAIVSAGPAEPLAGVQDLIANHPGRPGAVLVTLHHGAGQGQVAFQFTASGRLRVATLGLDLTASGLTPAEAAACTAIVELTGHDENAPVPVDTDAEDGLDSLVDAGGALRVELTQERPPGPAGTGSLLPMASADYEVETATTIEDLEALAPITPAETRQRIEEADPTLDADLDYWHDENARLPRLTLLGPVSARAYGDFKMVAPRRPFYAELLAFLILHPRGVTAAEVASAFSITKDRAYVDLTNLRKWLGADPRTGDSYLPPLRATRGSRGAGASAYRVTGVLSDYDLFRRLRARGQARGAAGMEDLAHALELVNGEPFTQLRETGWSWLLEGQRLDHVITCSIVDVGHIVKTHALAVDDLDLARAAVETTYTAAPYDETARLDLIQVAAVTGHTELAERHLVDGIFNRSDDDHGPIDLPERTARIVKQHGWDGT